MTQFEKKYSFLANEKFTKLQQFNDDLALEHVEGGEERGGAVALVVVGHGAEAPLLHRQARLGAVERLDLRFLVDREDDGMGRRIDVKPDDIAQFADEVGIVRELELPPAVRLQAVGTPDGEKALKPTVAPDPPSLETLHDFLF